MSEDAESFLGVKSPAESTETNTSIIFSFDGCIGRGRYWGTLAVIFAVNFLTVVVVGQTVGSTNNEASGLLFAGLVVGLPSTWIAFATYAKRWHDLGKSGWMALMLLIPWVNLLIMLYLGVARGTSGSNRYDTKRQKVDTSIPRKEQQTSIVNDTLEELKSRFTIDRHFAEVTVSRGGDNLRGWRPTLSSEERSQAVGIAQSVLSAPQQLVAQAEKAIVEGKMQDGVDLFRRALRYDPKVADTVYNTAFALHGGAAKRNQAAGGNNLYFSAGFSELDSAIAVMELLTDPPYERADVWYQLGIFLDHRCQCDRAIAAYERAIELEPESPDACDALNNLGILYYNRGRGVLGTKDTSSGGLIAFDPINNPDFAEAEEAFLNVISVSRNAIAKDPHCRGALINSHRILRDIYTHRLQGTKAVEHCLQLYQQAPDDEDAVQWLRKAEKNIGKKLL